MEEEESLEERVYAFLVRSRENKDLVPGWILAEKGIGGEDDRLNFPYLHLLRCIP